MNEDRTNTTRAAADGSRQYRMARATMPNRITTKQCAASNTCYRPTVVELEMPFVSLRSIIAFGVPLTRFGTQERFIGLCAFHIGTHDE